VKNSIWPVLLVLVAAAVGGIAWYLNQQQEAPAQQQAAAPAPAAPPQAAPPTHYPIKEAPPAAAPAKPLPALDDSDTAAQEVLSALPGWQSLADLLQLKNLVRRIVVTVDNLPRDKVSTRISVLRPVAGSFLTAGQGAELAISPANYPRYAAYASAAQAMNAKQLVAAYVHLYPLFQQAYTDLGYPGGYFNDRLVQVIDNLLAAPSVASPRLAQPNVLFTYADADLESRSAGQKMLMRMGPENEAIVKDKLREIRAELINRVHRH
jgi:hypothetical protein